MIWRILPKISDNIIKNNPNISPIILQLLVNRGITKENEAKNFLQPDDNIINDPQLFHDMAQVVDLIIRHIKQKNKIIIYGDYDADGVTAVAVLLEVLKTFKADVDIYIPDRMTEGYGLNKKALQEIAANGAKLIITVDNGIRNKEEVVYAKKLGLEVIVTDHHEAPLKKNEWPDCLTINPKTDSYPFKSLAGVGVAYKVACALIDKAKLLDEYKTRLKEKILDLVAIGTIADCVSLLGENRILVQRGLEIINKNQRIGLIELIKAAQINGSGKAINAWNIGWQIAPRLN